LKELLLEIDGLTSEKISIELRKLLKVGSDLEEEARNASAYFGYYAILAARAEMKFRRRETSFEIWFVKEKQKIIDSASPKKMSQKAAEEEIKRSSNYKNWKDVLFKAEQDSLVLNKCARALEYKIGCVQTLNANRRKEMK
jgi:hypothetical protein